MKRAVAVLVVVVAAFLGYRQYDSHLSPVNHYKRFAEEVLHRRYNAAAAMAEGLSAADLEKSGSQERIGAGPSMLQTLFPSRFQIDSQSVAPDGAVTLNAVQTVRFNPPGVESAMRPAMFATLNQIVTLRRGAGGWKVTAFENKFMAMDSLGSR